MIIIIPAMVLVATILLFELIQWWRHRRLERRIAERQAEIEGFQLKRQEARDARPTRPSPPRRSRSDRQNENVRPAPRPLDVPEDNGFVMGMLANEMLQPHLVTTETTPAVHTPIPDPVTPSATETTWGDGHRWGESTWGGSDSSPSYDSGSSSSSDGGTSGGGFGD